MSPAPSARIAVVMPALNEAEDIAQLVMAVRSQAVAVEEIIVVDDASHDQTHELAEQAGATVIRLFEQLGAWGATQTGLRYAVRKGYDVVVTLDADGQHNPADIEQLIEPLLSNEANVAIGTCPERGSVLRRIAWRWIKSTSGVDLNDITSGFRAYDRLALRRVASWKATLLDYQDIGVILLLQRTGMVIRDIGVTMAQRVHGKSRIFHNWGIVAYYMAHTLLLGFCKRIEIKKYTPPTQVAKISL